MTLSIRILGALVIESDNCRLGKVPKKARALLAFLAAQRGQTVSRERLADLLWPYQGSEQARHSLRNCLLELPKALGGNATEPRSNPSLGLFAIAPSRFSTRVSA